MSTDAAMKQLSVNATLKHTDNAADRVMVIPKDGDRFMLRVNDAILGCQSAVREENFSHQISVLESKLTAWMRAHGEKIHAAYLTCDSDGMFFVLVQETKEFDPDFQDQAAQLDLEIAQAEELDMIRLRVLALPFTTDESLASFIDVSKVAVAPPV